MNASETLATVFLNYAGLGAYADEGTIINGDPLKPIQFKTFWERPNRFKFQWTDSHCGISGAVWSNGKSPLKRITLPDSETVTELESLEQELQRLANKGILRGVLHTIPPLFFGHSELKCFLPRLRELHFIGPCKVEQRSFHRIIGSLHAQDDTELWIRQDDNTIGKIIYHEKATLEDFESTYEGHRISFNRIQTPNIEVIKDQIRKGVKSNPTIDSECLYDLVQLNNKIADDVFTS